MDYYLVSKEKVDILRLYTTRAAMAPATTGRPCPAK